MSFLIPNFFKKYSDSHNLACMRLFSAKIAFYDGLVTAGCFSGLADVASLAEAGTTDLARSDKVSGFITRLLFDADAVLTFTDACRASCWPDGSS